MVDVAAIHEGKAGSHHTRWGRGSSVTRTRSIEGTSAPWGNFQLATSGPRSSERAVRLSSATEYNKRILKIGEKGTTSRRTAGSSPTASSEIRTDPPRSFRSNERSFDSGTAARGGYVKLEKSPDLTYVSRESKQELTFVAEEKKKKPASAETAKRPPKRRARTRLRSQQRNRSRRRRSPRSASKGGPGPRVFVDGDVRNRGAALGLSFRRGLDLIRRAVTASQANRRQPYGSAPHAGARHSVRWSGKAKGSRVPRIRGTMIGAQAPGTVGVVAPIRATQAVWAREVNENERPCAQRGPRGTDGRLLRDVPGPPKKNSRRNLRLPVVLETSSNTTAPRRRDPRSVKILNRLGRPRRTSNDRRRTHIRAGAGRCGDVDTASRRASSRREGDRHGRRLFGNLSGVES